jgi:hypothetical protein
MKLDSQQDLKKNIKRHNLDGLNAWLLNNESSNFFGLDRFVEALRFNKLISESKWRIFWYNIKRFLQQRWRYYD